jgi:uncharacterized membrane protein (DUF106 family)
MGEAMKKSDWAALFLIPVFTITGVVLLYATGHYRWVLVMAILSCLNGTLFNYLMIQYRDMMCEYRSDFREARDRALRAEIASDRRRLREKLYSWEANPAQDASKEPWRRES